MKTVKIEVQLAPSGRGIDVFGADKMLKKAEIGSYKDQHGRFRDTSIDIDEFPELKQITKPTFARLIINVPREEGYYWVKLDDEWLIREWTGENWMSFHGNNYDEDMYNEIDETKIERVS